MQLDQSLTFTPQVSLLREIVVDAPDIYFLHSVTFCDKSNYRTAGINLPLSAPDENGNFPVELLIQQDTNVEAFNAITPVVHTVTLEGISFDLNSQITTHLIELSTSENRTSNLEQTNRGSTSSSTSSANEVDRPIP